VNGGDRGRKEIKTVTVYERERLFDICLVIIGKLAEKSSDGRKNSIKEKEIYENQKKLKKSPDGYYFL